MYNNNTATLVEPTPTPQPSPELHLIQDRLSRQNSTYTSLLYEVEEKLHSILNLRSPKPDQKGIEKPMSNDFVQAMHEQLEYMEQHNGRLEIVLNHIKRIIG